MGVPSFQSNAPLGNQFDSRTTGSGATNSFITIFANVDPTPFDNQYSVKQRWINFQNLTSPPREWILQSFSNKTGPTLANWVLIASGGPSVLSITVPLGVTEIVPNPLDGEITFTSTGGTVAITGSSASPNNHTINFDVTGGANPIEKVHVDVFTAPGTQPVVPDGTGQITITGNQVAAGTIVPNVIRTDSLAANTFTIEIQRSQAVATSTIGDNGVSHFDSKFFLVDANGFVTSTAIANTLGIQNLGVKLLAGVFSIVGANGQPLSVTNPAFVTLHSNTITGAFFTYQITASPNFHDNSSGSSTIAGNTFGFDLDLDCPNDVPFFIYAVSNTTDTVCEFMISRFPNSAVSPVAAKIAQTGLTTQGSFFSFNSVTAANFASTQCLSIGAIRMTKVATNANDWTVSALAKNDGIGQFYLDGEFSWPAGFFGAAANSFFKSNGGTAPIYSDMNSAYVLSKDNVVKIGYVLGTNTTPGAGGVTALLVSPFNAFSGGFQTSGLLPNVAMLVGTQSGGANTFVMNYQTTAVNAATLTNAVIAANGFSFTGQFLLLFS